MRKAIALLFILALMLPALAFAQASSRDEYIVKTYQANFEPDMALVEAPFLMAVYPLPIVPVPGVEPPLVSYPEWLEYLYLERFCPIWEEYGPEGETCEEALEEQLEAYQRKLDLIFLSWADFYESSEADLYRGTLLAQLMLNRPGLAKYLFLKSR